jgi:superfamily I DNA/RNA helicase/Zn-dependent peptidase ImmA (M78 family)
VEDLLRPRLLAARLLRWWRTREEASADGNAAASAPSSTASSAASSAATAATPVDALVAALGLDVATFPAAAHPGTLGYLEPGEDLIFVRAGLAEPVRRFTLAHELGHAVLHRGSGAAAEAAGALVGPNDDGSTFDPCDNDDLKAPLDTVAMSDETLRPGQAYSARARRESEANAFAAALLLPADRVREIYLTLPTASSAAAAPNDTTDQAAQATRNGSRNAPSRTSRTSRASRLSPARALAERFGVSEDVVLRRLAALLVPDEEALEELAEAEPSASASWPPITPGPQPLDADQRAAANAVPPALVIAGPGTGKTSTLVGRVAHLVREEGVPPGAILALTFSNKAAREMRERVGRLLAVAPVPADPATLLAAPLPVISTIHAFCGDLLRQYAPLVGLRPDFRLITATEGYFLLRRLARDLELSYYQPLTAPALYFPDLLAAISRAKDELIDPAGYTALTAAMGAAARTGEEHLAAARAAEVAEVYTAYQQALEERGDPDFGDIVRLAVRLLREQPDVLAEVRARYTHILVDEFQDINRAMGVLLGTLAGAAGPLWAVGDPDQAIYRFRGASPANIVRFESEYPGARVPRLTRNYRSYRPILEAAAAVAGEFIPGESSEADEVRTARAADRGMPSRPCVTLASAPDDTAEPAGLVAAIRARHAAGRALLDQAVLCRTRRGAQRVVAALRAAGIPTRVVAPLLEQDDVKDLLAIVALLAETTGAGLLRTGASEDHAYSREEARRVLEAAHARHVAPATLLAHSGQELGVVPGLTPAGRRGLVRLGAILAELGQAPDVATALARYAFGLTGLGKRLLPGVAMGDPVLRERAVHLARLLALAHAFEDQRRGAGDGGPGDRTSAAWAEFLEYVRVLVVLRQGASGAEDLLASADDGVWVLTVHASKGLEFPVVYLPGLAERRFPVQRQYDATPAPPGLTEHTAHMRDRGREEEAHLAEEACLFYVALTRARDELVLSVAERYGRVRARPSRFLAPIEQRLGDQLARARWEARPESETGDERPKRASADGVAQPRETPARRWDEPIGVAPLETYQRCPRQYAYQYVYGLRPQGAGLGALSRGLRETLRELRERFDSYQTTQGDHDADQAHQPPDAETPAATAPTLDDAHTLFERHWTAALDQAASEAVDPFEAVYRRYGRLIVGRAWQAHVERVRRMPVGPQRPPADAEEFERELTIQLGGRALSLTVDRVEWAGAPPQRRDVSGQVSAGRASSEQTPIRLVRHRLGRAAERPDLRALLYALAAEQQAARGQPAEVVQTHLTSGETERLRMSTRQRAALRDELDDALEGIESGNYPARPDPHVCQGCPFLLICPA